MKKFGFMVFFMCIFMTAQVFAETNTPKVEAQGAILIDFKTGRVLWAKNADAPLAMASTTKIMTAILAIEKGNLNETVTVSKRAAAAPPVKMKLTPGEEIKLSYLLYALMMQSSNDAAVAIAEHIGGSVEGFCAMMDEKALELGCTDTKFETPNGLDAGNHHSTASDMALIAKYALGNKTFVKIINTQNVSFASSKGTYDVANKNKLLSEFNGANGIKTGYTGKAGHCFVGAAERDGMQLISVVLASGWGNKGKQQKWVDTKAMLKYGFDNYEYSEIINADELACDLAVERSKTKTMSAAFEESYVLPLTKEEKSEVVVKLEIDETVKAPVHKGQTVGVAKIYIGDELCKEIHVLALGDADRHDLKTSMEKVLNEFVQMGTRGDAKIVLPEF